jgi:hypothetical protein
MGRMSELHAELDEFKKLRDEFKKIVGTTKTWKTPIIGKPLDTYKAFELMHKKDGTRRTSKERKGRK